MALGSSQRDYKSRANGITLNLKAHKLLTDKYLSAGLGQEAASREAFTELSLMTSAKKKRLLEKAAKDA